MVYLTFAGLHVLLCLLVLLGMIFEFLPIRKYMFLVVLLLPFLGVLIVLIQHFEIGFDSKHAEEIGAEKMKLDSELYRSVTVDDKRSDMTVPLEEALLINSAKDRRALIMDVLNEDPGEYVDLLQKAGNNEDTEVVHYAVTAMVELSKENDYMLQKLETAYNAAPDDIEVLSQYCDFLWDCLTQNLMQGQVEVMNRTLFSQLMQKKLAMQESLTDYAHLIENELKCNHFDTAGELIQIIREKWPESEEYVFLNVQYLAAMNKGAEIGAFIKEVENSNVYLSSKTKEVLAFWAT